MTTGNNFTCFACMYCAWYLMRWMISPSPETYQAVPEWLRPTYDSPPFPQLLPMWILYSNVLSRPNQLFMPHIKVVDFIIWPAFRELVVQIPAMQQRMEWFLDYSTTIRCDWSFPVEEALCRHEDTGLLDLCDLAKVRFELRCDVANPWAINRVLYMLMGVTDDCRHACMTCRIGH